MWRAVTLARGSHPSKVSDGKEGINQNRDLLLEYEKLFSGQSCAGHCTDISCMEGCWDASNPIGHKVFQKTSWRYSRYSMSRESCLVWCDQNRTFFLFWKPKTNLHPENVILTGVKSSESTVRKSYAYYPLVQILLYMFIISVFCTKPFA